MRKTAILPGMWGEADSDEIDEVQMSYAVVTEREGYRKLVCSGMGVPEGDLEAQTRTILESLEELLADVGGSFDDVTMMRWYVRDDRLDRESQTELHEIRAEFFDRPHYPASTMVGVADLLGDCLIEVETEAEIPDDEWDVDTVELEDVEME